MTKKTDSDHEARAILGAKTFESFDEAPKADPLAVPHLVLFLESYAGRSSFVQSVASQWRSKRRLSARQWECVKEAFEAAHISTAPSSPKEIQTPKRSIVPALPAGTLLIVSKWVAIKIAREAGYPRAHHALEVVTPHHETGAAYLLTVKLSAQRSSRCGVCGLTLTNPVSVEAGIGPICANRSEISFTPESLEELREKISKTIEVKTWIPKQAIKLVTLPTPSE